MRLETKKLLYDVLQAAKHLEQFSNGESIADYQALRQLSKEDPASAARVSEHQRIIAFRNIRSTAPPRSTTLSYGTSSRRSSPVFEER